MVRDVVIIFAALAGWIGCGGTLTPPDGGTGGGTGGVSPPLTGAGGGLPPDVSDGAAPGDTVRTGRDCLAHLPALPVAEAPCRFEIPAPPCPDVDRSRIGVLIDDVQIPQDHTRENGWSYTDETFTTIEIHGASCDALTNGSASGVTVFFYLLPT